MAESGELVWLWSGVTSYTLAWLTKSVRSNTPGTEQLVLALLSAGALLTGIANGVRWYSIGHGPFFLMYEILLSNLFTLAVVSLLIFWWAPGARKGAGTVTGVLALLGLWAVTESPEATTLPPTYDNYWLWIHVTFGKIFLGIFLVGTGLAVSCLRTSFDIPKPDTTLDPGETDDLIWRMVSVAFLFHSLMLIAGAVWAQSAWGRYWDWDPLETWAFITWLSIAVLLHLRITLHIPDWVGWLGVIGVFLIAFYTFLGMPFISLAPHKGAV